MEETIKYDVHCPCGRYWHADNRTNCGAFCDRVEHKPKRVLFLYHGMMVSFRVKPGDLDKFLEIIKDNGARMIEVMGGAR